MSVNGRRTDEPGTWSAIGDHGDALIYSRTLQPHGPSWPHRRNTCHRADGGARLKRHATRAGLDHEQAAGRSLRADFATSPASAGIPERVIAAQTGYRGTATLRRYMRESSLFRENAASAAGL
jgi:hypothetical protein